MPQEPPKTAQGDTTDRTAQKTSGKHKTDERQRNIPQPSAAQNDSREPQHETDDLTRTRFPFQRRDRCWEAFLMILDVLDVFACFCKRF